MEIFENQNQEVVPVIVYRNDNPYLKIDYGDHYYEGLIDKTQFPSSCKDNILIVKKSIEKCETDNQKIIGNFIKPDSTNNGIYRINIDLNYDLYTINNVINIPMNYYKKEQIDYINERFTKLENEIKKLKIENEELRLKLIVFENNFNQVDEEEISDEEENIYNNKVKKVIETKIEKKNFKK